MNFGSALEDLKDGMQVTREGWNGKGQFLELQRPDENSKMTLPYIFITTVSGDRVPWLASQTDLLAEDWELVEGLSQADFDKLQIGDTVEAFFSGPPRWLLSKVTRKDAKATVTGLKLRVLCSDEWEGWVHVKNTRLPQKG